MKKSITLTLLALMSIVSVHAAQQIGDLYYDLDDDNLTASVTYSDDEKYTGDIIIPASVTYNNNTYAVTTINDDAFSNCGTLTAVTIPNSITSIGSYAFRNCVALTALALPSSLTNIDDYAFFNCSALTAISVEADNTVYNSSNNCNAIIQTASNTLLLGCKNTIIPNTVTTIGESAFYGCTELTSISIPNSVTTIHDDAFCYCSNLTTVTIPNSVTSIGSRAFFHSRINSFNIPSSVTTIEDFTFYGCSQLTSITIPSNVTTIGSCAFGDCTALTSVTISDGVTTIGGEAFRGCSNLEAINIPNSVTEIQSMVFYECPKLLSITVPSTVTTIDSYAFDGVPNVVYNGTNTDAPWGAKCLNGTIDGIFVFADASKTSLLACSPTAEGSITIPNSVTTIGSKAFANCTAITSVTLPNGVTTIGEEAFSGCSNLESINIPNSVTEIQSLAFYECTKLLSVTVPSTVTTIDSYAFEGVLNVVYNGTNTDAPWGAKCLNGFIDGYFVYADNTKTTLVVCSSLAEGSITVPNTVTAINAEAFMSCRSITKVTILGNITDINDNTFFNCTLTSITLPNTITTIGVDAFGSCSELTSITIPSSVNYIQTFAFEYCSGLTEITVKAVVPPSIDTYTFYEVDHTIPLYVPDESVDDYKAFPYWSEFTNILPISQSPATAVDNIYSDNNNGNNDNNGNNTTNTTNTTPTKIFRNNQLLILHNNHTYTISGIIVE